MKNLIKNIAKRILRQELENLQNQANDLRQKIEEDKEYKTDAIISKSIMIELMRILPFCNQPLPDLFENLKQIKANRLSLINVAFVGRDNKILRLNFQTEPSGFKFSVYRKCRTFQYDLSGIPTDLTTYYWSIDGIKVVSDRDFEAIEFSQLDLKPTW